MQLKLHVVREMYVNIFYLVCQKDHQTQGKILCHGVFRPASWSFVAYYTSLYQLNIYFNITNNTLKLHTNIRQQPWYVDKADSLLT